MVAKHQFQAQSCMSASNDLLFKILAWSPGAGREAHVTASEEEFGANADGFTSNTTRGSCVGGDEWRGGDMLELPAGRWLKWSFNLSSYFTLTHSHLGSLVRDPSMFANSISSSCFSFSS